jgi:hypothetical protein
MPREIKQDGGSEPPILPETEIFTFFVQKLAEAFPEPVSPDMSSGNAMPDEQAAHGRKAPEAEDSTFLS